MAWAALFAAMYMQSQHNCHTLNSKKRSTVSTTPLFVGYWGDMREADMKCKGA